MNHRKLTDKLVVVSIALLIFTVVLILFPYNMLNGIGICGFTLETEKYGELGDFISGITTPILSASSILLLYSTYQTQKEELNETKSIIKQQQFENTFFKLVDSYHLTINTFEYYPQSSSTERYSGKRFFEGLFKNELSQEKYDAKLKKEITDAREPNWAERFNIWGNVYADSYFKNESTLFTWLALIENIFKYVDTAGTISNSEKEKYISFIRHQMAPYETVTIACHVIFRITENIPLKNLTRKYKIFPSPNHIWLLTNNSLSEFYNEQLSTAFSEEPLQ